MSISEIRLASAVRTEGFSRHPRRISEFSISTAITWCRSIYSGESEMERTAEMTWDNDGRATFSYGEERIAGQAHVIWRRIGTHAIFTPPPGP